MSDPQAEELRAAMRQKCRDVIGWTSHLDGLLTECNRLNAMMGKELYDRLHDVAGEVEYLIARVEEITGPRPRVSRRQRVGA